MIIRDVRLRMRIVTVIAVCLLSIPAYGAPALANDQPPPPRPFTVTRGGQTFQRTAFETELAPDGRLMRAGSFLVTFRAHSSRLDQDDAHRLAGALGIERLFSADAVRVQVGQARTSAALLVYLGHPAVERVEPDYVARVVLTPNDPRFAEQWGMIKIRAGSPAGSTEPSAWDVSTSSVTTRVAVLDCGVYNEGSSSFISPDGLPGHPDLRGKVTDNKNFTTAPDADDFCNHGTHVAGIAAANTDNGVGVAGVGHQARIINVKVLGDNGSGSFAWIINGILYAAGCDTNPCAARRADIINMSLGAKGRCSTSLQSAIDKAWGQGLVIVAAAGNAGARGAITPANCNHVMGVAASDQNDAKATFSNFGAGVDVAAPGVGILSSDFVGGYSSFNGTSMASPHVAGLAALVWTTSHNTGNQAVVDRITCTANENALAGSTHGRIDAYAAVVVPGTCPPPPPTVSAISPTGGPLAGGTAVTITGTNFSSPATVTIGASAASGVTVVSATSITATTPAGAAGSANVVVTNADGQAGTCAGCFTYAAAPTVSAISPTSGPTAGGTVVTITGTGFDPAAGATTMRFGPNSATGVSCASTTSCIATSPAGSGTVDVTVTVGGQTSTTSAADRFTYVAVSACTAASFIANPASPQAPGTSVTLTASATGCSSAEFRWWIEAPGAAWRIVRDYGANTFVWNTTGLAPGTYRISVHARAVGSTAFLEAESIQPYTLAFGSCTAASFIANPASPQAPGTSVTLTASATGCSSAEFRWWIEAPGAAWRMVRDYGANTFVWNTTGLAPGTYRISVHARAVGSTAFLEADSIQPYTLSP